MSDLGKYQSDIQQLPLLGIGDYERIFKVYSKTDNNKEFLYYNILSTINVDGLDPSFFTNYTTESDLPLTTLSWKMYGDIRSWWLIHIANREVFKYFPFIIKGGTQLRKFTSDALALIFEQITQQTQYSGRHN